MAIRLDKVEEDMEEREARKVYLGAHSQDAFAASLNVPVGNSLHDMACTQPLGSEVNFAIFAGRLARPLMKRLSFWSYAFDMSFGTQSKQTDSSSYLCN
jgi:hypothetical protein